MNFTSYIWKRGGGVVFMWVVFFIIYRHYGKTQACYIDVTDENIFPQKLFTFILISKIILIILAYWHREASVNSLRSSDAFMNIAVLYCSMNLVIIGSDNGLSAVRCQAITRINADVLSIRPPGTKFIEISIKVRRFSLKKMHLKMSSAKMAAILPLPQCQNHVYCLRFVAFCFDLGQHWLR